jgi:hypothetical protein
MKLLQNDLNIKMVHLEIKIEDYLTTEHGLILKM